ncbi:hypothetical protein P280DRAFT_98 [Massarina eburnea CBS 473.64]|uniref:BZIP domain-containing protein n=1 Tax=Massarina eburnea CBS 473.64 TaxID=1395130 RepID=A0A6A6SDP7_9PLEO|nr:hypothetical protein P280DRAFT_98 [Massarina eburnea CBS 473.64]
MSGAAGAPDAPDTSPSASETSHSHSHTPANASGPPAKKRRIGANTGTGASSSRGVANLTPEQLARKRANDREAQRAIRERTKNQIDTLNARIRELESQQPYLELRAVVREKEDVVRENGEVRKRLESVVAIIDPILRRGLGGLAAGGLNELAAAAERSPLCPLPGHQPPRSLHTTLGEIAASSTTTPNDMDSPTTDSNTTRPWHFSGDAPTSHVRQWSNDSPHRASHISNETSFDERMGVDFLCEGNGPGHQRPADQALVSLTHPAFLNDGPPQPTHAPQLSPFCTLPRNTTPTCPLDALCLDFISGSRTRAASGMPPADIVGPAYPNFTALLFPERNIESHPLSKLNTDILGTFPDIYGLPEQVANIYILFLVMRWLIWPTRENYERLPEWIQPRPSQLFMPHPFWMTYLPWPQMRDSFIATRTRPDFNSFFIPYTMTISLNWPYPPRDVLIPAPSSTTSTKTHHTLSTTSGSSPYSPAAASPASHTTTAGKEQEYVMNPAFEAHLRQLKNWSVGPSFAQAFPDAVRGVWIKDGEDTSPNVGSARGSVPPRPSSSLPGPVKVQAQAHGLGVGMNPNLGSASHAHQYHHHQSHGR